MRLRQRPSRSSRFLLYRNATRQLESALEEAGTDVGYIVAKHAEKDRGASMLEYTLVVLLVALIVLISIRVVGQTASQTFSAVNSNLN